MMMGPVEMIWWRGVAGLVVWMISKRIATAGPGRVKLCGPRFERSEQGVIAGPLGVVRDL
jgi:hypothetical protein